MQTPEVCTNPSFGLGGCGPLTLQVTLTKFANGQVTSLPTPDVNVVATLDDLYAALPYDAGYGKEALTLVFGTISVAISLNNFDAHFDMTFTRPNGDSLVIQNGRAALLDAAWKTRTFCN
jgi:hypothetical protein